MDTSMRKRNRIMGNNKGVSLIELVIAMALFMIVIVPICASFITSMRVNQKSRKMMAANDLAQSVMEGFSGKTYEGVKKSIASIGNGELSGNLALSSVSFNGDVSGNTNVSANLYNLETSGMAVAWDTDMSNVKAGLTSISENQITWAGTTVSNNMLVSYNKALATSMNKAAASDFKALLDTAGKSYTDPVLMGVTNTDENISFLCYSGLHSEGYYFDAVVMFIPMANKSGQKYYSYEAMIYIYEVDKKDLSTRLSKDPVLSLMTGIKNRNG